MTTNMLLGGLCLGQVGITVILLAIYSKFEHSNKRADKMLSVCQELADRVWERMGSE